MFIALNVFAPQSYHSPSPGQGRKRAPIPARNSSLLGQPLQILILILILILLSFFTSSGLRVPHPVLRTRQKKRRPLAADSRKNPAGHSLLSACRHGGREIPGAVCSRPAWPAQPRRCRAPRTSGRPA